MNERADVRAASAGPSKSLTACALIALTLAALIARLWTIDFALPYAQEPDPHILGQIELLSKDVVTDEDVFYSSIYPHLFARAAMLFGDLTREPAGIEAFTLEEHLAAASRLHVRVRTVIACLSVLIVPAAFWIASFFVGRKWALFAAALAATSTLSLQFGQMARPHAAASPLISLAVAGAMYLRRRGDTRAFVVAGVLAALAVASLTNACVALVACALAYVTRNGAKNRWLDWRLLIPIALLALSVRLAYPFFFVERPPGAEPPTEEGTFNFGWQSINWGDFAGQGFPTLGMTFWYYEPVALGLALYGLIAWAQRPRERSADARERNLDLAVALSFVLLYALIIGLYRRNQQRFVLPLVPFVAALAACGVRALSQKLPRIATVALIAVALAVPTLACIGFTRMRMRPHTLAQLAAWIEANVERDERVGIHATFDVPLVRPHEDLFDAAGAPRVVLSPWLAYQQRWMDRVWRGERWNVVDLYGPRAGQMAVLKDPKARFAELDLAYAVVPGGTGYGTLNPLVAAVRNALPDAGERVEELPHEARPPVSGLEGLDTPHFTAFVLTATWFGPQVDVWKLARTER